MANGSSRLGSVLAIAVVIGLAPTLAIAGGPDKAPRADSEDYCSATAETLLDACRLEVRADDLVARAICLNVSDAAARAQCFADASAARSEGNELCPRQAEARKDVCRALGEGRYDPDFDPALFDDDFTKLTNPNPYRPLGIGNRWEYRGGTQTVSVEILNQTKLIEGVTCIVARDRVVDAGDLIEDTDDWFAQAKNGDVYYCGEEVKDYESFDGDNPRRPELVKIDGSFKWGRNGDKGGIYFHRSPTAGVTYREEMSLTNAEDVSEVLSTNYAFGTDPELDEFVPRELAQLLCSSADCVVNKAFQPTEPGVFARKYYAHGIGFFLETKQNGEVVQLVGCNVDPRCQLLPTP